MWSVANWDWDPLPVYSIIQELDYIIQERGPRL